MRHRGWDIEAGRLELDVPREAVPAGERVRYPFRIPPCSNRSCTSQVQDVNVNGVLFTAQAAGQQMERFGNGGSIVMIASISGHGSNKVRDSIRV